ncbi:hypothetical protein HDV57DRAFT_10737 [Trichoderma longibrachiatum]
MRGVGASSVCQDYTRIHGLKRALSFSHPCTEMAQPSAHSFPTSFTSSSRGAKFYDPSNNGCTEGRHPDGRMRPGSWQSSSRTMGWTDWTGPGCSSKLELRLNKQTWYEINDYHECRQITLSFTNTPLDLCGIKDHGQASQCCGGLLATSYKLVHHHRPFESLHRPFTYASTVCLWRELSSDLSTRPYTGASIKPRNCLTSLGANAAGDVKNCILPFGLRWISRCET